MRYLIIALLLVSGCWGYASVDNKLTGQVKKVHHYTPLVCPDYDSTDISLGVMRNGVGSMSSEDLELTVWNQEDLEILKQAALNGQIVEVSYSNWRFAPCRETSVINWVKLSK